MHTNVVLGIEGGREERERELKGRGGREREVVGGGRDG